MMLNSLEAMINGKKNQCLRKPQSNNILMSTQTMPKNERKIRCPAPVKNRRKKLKIKSMPTRQFSIAIWIKMN